ncbi:hypothetical protein [Streptomyces inhibens]|uniref:hypothetical protein n=1 Tax=Streptomyces inhibens TaxID=2293571 RepID=UPI001EE73104|nr:hypothetical protein [Streptomyces inhibens]UKY50772.1 hypothetical protein KI385_19430 [Streptomyces inhibens]
MPKTAPHPRAQARWALGVAGALALTGSQAVVRRERAGEASGVATAVTAVTAGLGPALSNGGAVAGTGSGARPSPALPAAVCLAAAGALALVRVLRREGRCGGGE